MIFCARGASDWPFGDVTLVLDPEGPKPDKRGRILEKPMFSLASLKEKWRPRSLSRAVDVGWLLDSEKALFVWDAPRTPWRAPSRRRPRQGGQLLPGGARPRGAHVRGALPGRRQSRLPLRRQGQPGPRQSRRRSIVDPAAAPERHAGDSRPQGMAPPGPADHPAHHALRLHRRRAGLHDPDAADLPLLSPIPCRAC